MMREKSLVKVISLSLITALTLASSLVVSFALVNWMVDTLGETENIIDIILRGLLVLFAIPLIGGAAWGLGTAILMRADKKSTARTGALNWGISVFSAGFVLYVIMAFGPQISALLPFPMSVHTFFNLLFVPCIGIVAGLNVRSMSGKLGLESLKNLTGRNAGLAAALGFLLVSLILQFGLGWEVGKPVPGKYSMISIMHWGNFASALAGGAAMGWTLVRGRGEMKVSGSNTNQNPQSPKLASQQDFGDSPEY
jgi:hypothetical protein